MEKKKLLQYMDSIIGITNSLRNPSENKFGLQCKRFKYFVMGFDEMAIYETDDEIIVAINGSDDDDEWKSNSNVWPVLDDTHNGYHNRGLLYLKTVEETLERYVKETGKPVVFVGHSRGGALVQVMCWKWDGESECVTFGSPRVFTRKGKRRRKFKHTRVFSKYDPITRVPMTWLPPFFKHYQTNKIKINKRIKGKFSHTSYRELIEAFL